MKWTTEHINILKQKYPDEGTSILELAENHSRKAIKKKAQKLGIKYVGKRAGKFVKWDEKEIKILRGKYPEQGYQIPELLENGRTKSSINDMAHHLKIRWKNRLKRINITGDLKEIFDGLMLGDGGLHSARVKKTATLTVAQTESRKEWLFDLQKKFETLGIPTTFSLNGKERDAIGINGKKIHIKKSYRIQTAHFVDFRTEMKKWGYFNTETKGKNSIPENVSITPLSLALFYMGDGSLVEMRKGKKDYRMQFSTQCFNKKDINILIQKINKQYGWHCLLGKHPCGRFVMNMYRWREIIQFLKLTKPHMVNCFDYKWRII